MTQLAQDIFPPERYGLVTGSRCTPLVPKRSAEKGMDTLARTLAKERYFQYYDELETWQMEHGKMNEHPAFEYWNEMYEPIQKGRFIMDGDIGGSTDAEGEDFGVDFKCPTTLENWLNFLYEPITDGIYYNQAQLYMILTGHKRWVVAAYLMETDWMSTQGLKYPVSESNRIILNEIIPDQEWIDKFYSNLPKVIELRDQYVSLLKFKFG